MSLVVVVNFRIQRLGELNRFPPILCTMAVPHVSQRHVGIPTTLATPPLFDSLTASEPPNKKPKLLSHQDTMTAHHQPSCLVNTKILAGKNDSCRNNHATIPSPTSALPAAASGSNKRGSVDPRLVELINLISDYKSESIGQKKGFRTVGRPEQVWVYTLKRRARSSHVELAGNQLKSVLERLENEYIREVCAESAMISIPPPRWREQVEKKARTVRFDDYTIDGDDFGFCLFCVYPRRVLKHHPLQTTTTTTTTTGTAAFRRNPTKAACLPTLDHFFRPVSIVKTVNQQQHHHRHHHSCTHIATKRLVSQRVMMLVSVKKRSHTRYHNSSATHDSAPLSTD
eukprot:scaffold8444_cov56-Cylindrotheca_fusiformis.AAC.4